MYDWVLLHGFVMNSRAWDLRLALAEERRAGCSDESEGSTKTLCKARDVEVRWCARIVRASDTTLALRRRYSRKPMPSEVEMKSRAKPNWESR